MTPAEADKRIILSRQSLVVYERMVAAGEMPIAAALDMIFQEVGLLEDLALAHPVKAEKLMRLTIEWTKLHEMLRAKLH